MTDRVMTTDAAGRTVPLRRLRGASDSQRFDFIGWDVQDSGCWIWRGHKNPKGYGKFHYGGGQMAHRFSLERKMGRKIAKGMECLHLCNNRSCVNPEHLREGSHAENMLQAAQDGRLGHAILTPDDVRSIRQMSGSVSNTELARLYGVSQGAISAIQTRKNWAWVPDEKEEN